MSISFPIISRVPSTFNVKPINKSLVPEEKVGNLYASGRESYIGNPYSYNVDYTNIDSDAYVKVLNFYNGVKTLFPFYFSQNNNVYSVTFDSTLNTKKTLFNYYDISFDLRTCFSSMEKHNNYNNNLITSFSSNNENQYSVLSINGTNVSATSNGIETSLVLSNTINLELDFYILRTRLFLFSGEAPMIAIPSINILPKSYNSAQIKKDYFEEQFLALNQDSYVMIWNDTPSSWFLNIELIRN